MDKILYAGNGSDIITLTGLGNDYADISPHTAVRFARLGNLYDVELNNFANITVSSSLTNIDPNLAKSLAILHTSATGADTYTGGPAKSVLSGTGYTNEADSFTGVVVYAPATNTTSQANLTTSATSNADEFGSLPFYSFVQAPDCQLLLLRLGFRQGQRHRWRQRRGRLHGHVLTARTRAIADDTALTPTRPRSRERAKVADRPTRTRPSVPSALSRFIPPTTPPTPPPSRLRPTTPSSAPMPQYGHGPECELRPVQSASPRSRSRRVLGAAIPRPTCRRIPTTIPPTW